MIRTGASVNSETSRLFWWLFREAASREMTDILFLLLIAMPTAYRRSSKSFAASGGRARAFNLLVGKDVFGEYHALILPGEILLKDVVVGQMASIFHSVSLPRVTPADFMGYFHRAAR